MGYFEIYCAFCAGPLFDAQKRWASYIEHLWTREDQETKEYIAGLKTKQGIIRTSDADGAFWADWVGVNPAFPEFVSPPCSHDGYGTVEIDAPSVPQEWDDTPRVNIHRGCLSLLCRRIHITPCDFWKSLYGPDADYRRYGGHGQGLLYCIQYYDMDGRNGQDFEFAVERQTPMPDNPGCVIRSPDLPTMEQCNWLLARPTLLPVAPPLISDSFAVPQSAAASSTTRLRVFMTAELLDLILDNLVMHVTEKEYATSISPVASFVPPRLMDAAKTLFSVIQLNRYFYTTILTRRQDLFLRLIWEFGWMLPASPLDWDLWRNGSLTHPDDNGRLLGDLNRDWRKYLLVFLRKEDPHVKNRWRFHRMHMQFACGKMQYGADGQVMWKWKVGALGVRTALVSPEPFSWERL